MQDDDGCRWAIKRSNVDLKKFMVVGMEDLKIREVAIDCAEWESAKEFADEANRMYLGGFKNF